MNYCQETFLKLHCLAVCDEVQVINLTRMSIQFPCGAIFDPNASGIFSETVLEHFYRDILFEKVVQFTAFDIDSSKEFKIDSPRYTVDFFKDVPLLSLTNDHDMNLVGVIHRYCQSLRFLLPGFKGNYLDNIKCVFLIKELQTPRYLLERPELALPDLSANFVKAVANSSCYVGPRVYLHQLLCNRTGFCILKVFINQGKLTNTGDNIADLINNLPQDINLFGGSYPRSHVIEISDIRSLLVNQKVTENVFDYVCMYALHASESCISGLQLHSTMFSCMEEPMNCDEVTNIHIIPIYNNDASHYTMLLIYEDTTAGNNLKEKHGRPATPMTHRLLVWSAGSETVDRRHVVRFLRLNKFIHPHPKYMTSVAIDNDNNLIILLGVIALVATYKTDQKSFRGLKVRRFVAGDS